MSNSVALAKGVVSYLHLLARKNGGQYVSSSEVNCNHEQPPAWESLWGVGVWQILNAEVSFETQYFFFETEAELEAFRRSVLEIEDLMKYIDRKNFEESMLAPADPEFLERWRKGELRRFN